MGVRRESGERGETGQQQQGTPRPAGAVARKQRARGASQQRRAPYGASVSLARAGGGNQPEQSCTAARAAASQHTRIARTLQWCLRITTPKTELQQ